MTASERSVSHILRDIIRDFQEIVRSELRLAKSEFRDEARKAKSATVLITGGALTALFALLFLLITFVDALSLVMPNWAAALIVAVALAIIAGGGAQGGYETLQTRPPHTGTDR
jgi:hypothetical protein